MLRYQQQGPPQALTTVGRPIHHRRGAQARHVQAGKRKWRSPHQCLEHTAATSLLSLEFRAICTSFVLAFLIFRNNKEVCFTCLFFGNLPDHRGLGCARTLRYAWLYPRQSHASLGGYYGGNPRTSPKSHQCFSKYFCLGLKLLVSLEKTDARRKQLRYGAGRVVGPPTPPGYGTPLTTLHLRCLRTRTPSQTFVQVAYKNTEIK